MKRFSLLSVLCIFLFTACAKQGGEGHKRFPDEHIPESERVDIPPPPPVERVGTPKRSASRSLIDEGISLLQQKDYDKALRSFENAIQVDPENGIAYFYAAKANVQRGKPESALGFLDKAELLMGHDEKWKQKIDELRTEAKGGLVNSPDAVFVPDQLPY